MGKFVLEVKNPRNEMQVLGWQGLTAPRVKTLDGIRIAIVSEKPDGCLYLEQLKKVLEARHPTSTIDIIIGFIFKPEIFIDQLKTYDTFIYGVRNTAAFNTEPAIVYEKAGIPGVHLCVGDNLFGQTLRNRIAFGLPGLRMIKLPTERWPGEDESELFVKLANDTVEEVEAALLAPLTEEEINPKPVEFDTADMTFEGEDYDEAFAKFQETFFEKGYTDGMSVAAPTPEAVKKMLTGTSRDPAEVIEGTMTPGYGIVTIEKIAVNAVMAGAKPEYMPVIITAVEMLCDQGFCAFHAIATVCSTQLLIQVNGPLAQELGMNSGFGYLGPGTRANSAIGRAVSLSVINLGWMNFDVDGGMKGQPSRYCNLIFTENAEYSPWEPYHVSMGFKPEDSTVMVDEILHVDGDWPFEIARMPSCTWTYGLEADVQRMAERVVGASPTSLESVIQKEHNIHKLSNKEVDVKGLISHRNYFLLIYPGLARELAAKGFTRESLARHLADYNRFPWDDVPEELKPAMLKLAESGEIPGLSADDCKPGGTIPQYDTNRLAILVAGPLQGTVVGMTNMGGYGGIQAPVPFDKPPKSPFFIKKITGATLTKAGR